MRDASKSSLGSSEKKFRSRKIAKGSPYAVWASQMDSQLPVRPSVLCIFSTGTHVSCRGSTSSATMIMKIEVPAPEAHPGEGVCGKGSDDDGQDGGGNGDDEAVEEVVEEMLRAENGIGSCPW